MTGNASLPLDTNGLPSFAVESAEEVNIRYFMELIPVTIFYVLVAIVGVIGNILVLIIFPFCKEYRSHTMRVFVICFGLIDLLTCLLSIPADIFKYRKYFSNKNEICKLSCFFHTFVTSSAALIFLIVAIDRYRRVCQTFKPQISTRLAKRLCVFMVLLGFLISIPAPIMCGTKQLTKENMHGTNTSVEICGAEKRFERSLYRQIYKYFLVLLLTILSVVYVVLYIMIGRKIIRHVRLRAGGGSISCEPGGKLTSRKDNSLPLSPISDDSFTNTRRDSLDNAENADEISMMNCSGNHSNNGNSYSNYGNRKRSRLESQNSRSSDRSRTPKRLFSRSMSIFSTISERRQSNATIVPNKTLIWLILTALFIVTYFVHAGLAFVDGVYRLEPSSFALYMLFNRLYSANHILNPIVYACLDQRFRRSCFRLFRCVKK